MPVRVDQAGQQRLAPRVDPPGDVGRLLVVVGADQLHHLAVLADHQPREMLQLAVRANLHTIGVIDQRIGTGGGGGEQRGERDQGRFHGLRHSIVCRVGKG